jgi:hypothetical protein
MSLDLMRTEFQNHKNAAVNIIDSPVGVSGASGEIHCDVLRIAQGCRCVILTAHRSDVRFHSCSYHYVSVEQN